MDWNTIGTQIITGIFEFIISAVGIYIIYLINKYIKNEKLKTILNSLHNLIKNSVLEVYQTYVEELKDKNIFDAKAQKKALERCLKIINTNMPIEVEEWLKLNYTDIESYIKGLIEAQIALLKNQSKKEG